MAPAAIKLGRYLILERRWRHSRSLATNETSQKFQIVEYMIWLSKVFGSVIIVESGQLATPPDFAKAMNDFNKILRTHLL